MSLLRLLIPQPGAAQKTKSNEQDFLTIAYGNCWGRLSNLEVWFQRPKDIVRKLVSGDLDLGIVGLDTVSEYGQGNEDLVLVHDIPKYGIFENVNSMKELAQMPQWTPEKPLRVATMLVMLSLVSIARDACQGEWTVHEGLAINVSHMGIAEAIVDLVSSGTTLRENNLKEIEGGVILQSQEVLDPTERLEAHLRAIGQFTVTANMRGSSQEEVAE
ncbi:LOW QUALITY PROTEIN: hypothetical protein CsSME_00044144 [Camellia sinensis var. sinensis]